MGFYEELAAAVGGDHIRRDEPMSSHTTFCIGGPADYFVTAVGENELREGIRLCLERGIPWFVSGRGSNLLVGDGGYRGVIFNICRTMDDIMLDEGSDALTVTAGAGTLFSAMARKVCSLGYSGCEYAVGIPGTLGGAVTMNAGAYGGEVADAVIWADLMDREGNVSRLSRDDLNLSYRHSIIMDQGGIVLRCAFAFPRGDRDTISEKVTEFTRARREKQPLEYPSAGSTFKRPAGYFAGKLIQDCGLKCCSIGGAQVSMRHSGFIINTGNATARDVRRLIEHVQEEVYKMFHVRLEPEVKFLGDFI